MSSLAIVGGTVVDVIFSDVAKLPVWPRHTEFTPKNLVLLPRGPIVTLGGNGANAAYVAAASGADIAVTLHTQLGNDALGELARGWLSDVGCRIQSPASAATALNVTAANRRQQRGTFFYPGEPIALPKITALNLPSAPRALLVCGWPHPPLAKLGRYCRRLRRAGTFTALDAGPILGCPWSLAALRDVWGGLDLFLSNDYELRHITRTQSLAAALRRLRRDFSGHVVVKIGARGAAWLPAGVSASATAIQPFAAPRVRVVNTVGAGDSFNGALLAAWVRGADFPAAIRRATRVAASVVASAHGILGVKPVAR